MLLFLGQLFVKKLAIRPALPFPRACKHPAQRPSQPTTPLPPFRPQCASVYDVAVHPELQRLGLGSKLVRLLVQQIYRRRVYDIGCIAPQQLRPFFRKCEFDIDREGSSPMMLTDAAAAARSAGADASSVSAVCSSSVNDGVFGESHNGAAGSEQDGNEVLPSPAASINREGLLRILSAKLDGSGRTS